MAKVHEIEDHSLKIFLQRLLLSSVVFVENVWRKGNSSYPGLIDDNVGVLSTKQISDLVSATSWCLLALYLSVIDEESELRFLNGCTRVFGSWCHSDILSLCAGNFNFNSSFIGLSLSKIFQSMLEIKEDDRRVVYFVVFLNSSFDALINGPKVRE